MTDKRHYGTPTQASALEVPAPIRAEALELARVLRWLPIDHGEVLREEQTLLRAEQRGWYHRLRLLCAVSPIPGYLRVVSDLWKLAGAHSGRVWNDHSAAVMACFQFATIDDEPYLYHPQLLRVIAQQVEKIHKKRQKSEVSSGPRGSTGGEQLPLYLFSVLRGLEKPKGRSVSAGGVSDGSTTREQQRIAERIAELRRNRNATR